MLRGGETVPPAWAALFASIDAGTYSTDYAVGDVIPLDLGTEGLVDMQIVAFNADENADEETVPVTLISKQVLETTTQMNPARAGSTGSYTEGTGTIGGWEKSEMRAYLQSTIKPLIPAAVMSRIVPVTKYSTIRNTAGSSVNNGATVDDLWIPSSHEVISSGVETKGPSYSSIFTDNTSRKKVAIGTTSGKAWWLRTAYNTTMFDYINSQGSLAQNTSTTLYRVVLGFCVG